jgi:hypothetical protein
MTRRLITTEMILFILCLPTLPGRKSIFAYRRETMNPSFVFAYQTSASDVCLSPSTAVHKLPTGTKFNNGSLLMTIAEIAVEGG